MRVKQKIYRSYKDWRHSYFELEVQVMHADTGIGRAVARREAVQRGRDILSSNWPGSVITDRREDLLRADKVLMQTKRYTVHRMRYTVYHTPLDDI